MDHIQRSIFATNAFASEYPEEHVKLWQQFEKEVPVSKRSGAYGADNAAYIKWLREKKVPTFMNFINSGLVSRTSER